ncbi:MAG: hypothetical protein SH859_13785 [Hyphomicrobium aestuarii]|nr:hypothetical protein [Hyphomicrobium aestuarii]
MAIISVVLGLVPGTGPALLMATQASAQSSPDRRDPLPRRNAPENRSKKTVDPRDVRTLTSAGPMTFAYVRSSDPACEADTAYRGALPNSGSGGQTGPNTTPNGSSNPGLANPSANQKLPCFEWIAADGTIDQSSPARLKRILARLQGRKLPIFINSPGGSVDDSIEMARTIRTKRLDVVVARTEYVACPAGNPACKELKARDIRLGQPAALARCASSCPFVLAGGVRRLVGPGAYVGVHRAVTYRILTKLMRTYRFVPNYELGSPTGTKRRLVSEKPVSRSIEAVETKRETYDKIEANFVTMGVARGVMAPMLATPNTEMRWLSNAEIGQFKLATDWLNGQQLVASRRGTPGLATGTTQGSTPGSTPGSTVGTPATVTRTETTTTSVVRASDGEGWTSQPSIEHSTAGPPKPSIGPASSIINRIDPAPPADPPTSWFGLDQSPGSVTDPVTGFAPGSGL